MNLTALRQHAVTLPRQDAFTGTWRVLQWQPDLFSPQRFAVGVVVESSDGGRAFRLMDKPGRIECFFSPSPIKQAFVALMAMVRNQLAESGPLLLPSPNVIMSEPYFVRGESADAVAQRLFIENVPAARPRTDAPETTSFGPDTDETRREVSVFLKQMTDMAFERIVRENGETLSDHFLDVTLAPDHGAGSVISVCYAKPTIELKILRAAHDISAYASAQKRNSKAIFMLEPTDEIRIPAKERREMDQMIGNECWKLEQSGFATPRNTRIYDMAKDIRDWAIPLLAP